jgi:hypothetical protein
MLSLNWIRSISVGSALLLAASGVSTQAVATPLVGAGASGIAPQSDIVQVASKRRAPPKHASKAKRNRNNAAIGAAIGLGVLGIAAAAAASQNRRGVYYSDDYYGHPTDAWGRPVRVRPYQQQFYEEDRWGRPVQRGWRQPAYGYGYQDHDPWAERRARDAARAQREAARQQRWAQEQQWRQQQQWQGRPQYRGPIYVQPNVDSRLDPYQGWGSQRELDRARGGT